MSLILATALDANARIPGVINPQDKESWDGHLIPRLRFEDVFTTGFVRLAAGITAVNVPEMRVYDTYILWWISRQRAQSLMTVGQSTSFQADIDRFNSILRDGNYVISIALFCVILLLLAVFLKRIRIRNRLCHCFSVV